MCEGFGLVVELLFRMSFKPNPDPKLRKPEITETLGHATRPFRPSHQFPCHSSAASQLGKRDLPGSVLYAASGTLMFLGSGLGCRVCVGFCFYYRKPVPSF